MKNMENKEIITGKENIEIRMPELVKLEYLKPNPWNPNKVAKPEMELLKISIKKSGFFLHKLTFFLVHVKNF